VKIPLLEIVVLAFLPMTLRTVLYLLVCSLRSIHISILNACLISGAGALLMIVPIPIPYFLHQPLVIGIAIVLFARYTEAELFPDAIFIPLGVELFSGILMDQVLVPLLA
jgi:hypothetical protein